MNLTIREPQVIWEHMESEIIVISLTNGHYYNIQETGMNLWLCIAAQMNYEDIVQQILQHYSIPQSHIEQDLLPFLHLLLTEELVVETQHLAPTPLISTIWSKNYSKPTITKYTDMQELLLIDPIHEVDQHGWPNRYPLPEENA